MNTRQAIRKVFLISVWTVISGGMLTLLVAAIGKKNKETCSDYTITIHAAADKQFVDENDIRQVLMTISNGKIKGQPMSAINLPRLEQSFESNSWIKDAELFFDNRDRLHVSITEREPIARIFNVAGDSYYIDNTGRKMPLSPKLSARVPVITGFPVSKLVTARDSSLLRNTRAIAAFILSDPFWMAQVSEINITGDREFEMIPTIGGHIVKLGDGENPEQKFRRLLIFYQQVLSKTGFNQYKLLDVRFAGQVVALKQADITKVDSVQLRRNVEKLLKEASDVQNDSVTEIKPIIEKPGITADDKIAGNSLQTSAIDPKPATKVGHPSTNLEGKGSQMPGSRLDGSSQPAKTQAGSQAKDKKEKPKAEMPKRNE